MIRKALPEECEMVANFMTRFESCTKHVKVDAAYTGKVYEQFLRDGKGVIFLLCDDVTGEMQGGLGGIIGPDLHAPGNVAVETFWYVGEEFRGKGLKLMMAFEEWAKRKGCKKIAMIHMVDSHPESLSALYRRRGYELVEQHFVREVQS